MKCCTVKEKEEEDSVDAARVPAKEKAGTAEVAEKVKEEDTIILMWSIMRPIQEASLEDLILSTKAPEKAEEKEEKERAKEKDSVEDGKVKAKETHLQFSCNSRNPLLPMMLKSSKACQKDHLDVQSVDPDGMTRILVPHSRDALQHPKRKSDLQWVIHFPFAQMMKLLHLYVYLSGYHLNLFTLSIKSHHQLHGYFHRMEEALAI